MDERVSGKQQVAQLLFALGMMGLGFLALVYGHLGLPWYSIPKWVPWREVVTYASGVVLLVGGTGLLFARTTRLSTRILLPYLLTWLLLQLPALVAAPLIEVIWQNAGELAVLVAGAWIVFAKLAEQGEGSKLRFAAGENGMRIARILFALSLLAFGLSHFVYEGQTTSLVPAWLPFRNSWAYITGAAQIAAGIGVLFSIAPRLAARLEAALLSVFTLLVWPPAILATPTSVPTWTEFLFSWAITAGAWVVAENISVRDTAISSSAWRTPRGRQ